MGGHGGHDDKYYDEQIKDDLEEVQGNAQVIDLVNTLERVFGAILPGGGGRFFGRTNFEGHRLNDMIDMVEPANPEQVEEVGSALLKASTAIDEAAEQLRVDIAKVDWEGESAEAFETWSTNLVTKAKALATYSDTVGQQITLAGSGLASVRKSMPPRDTRVDPKSVSDIPSPARVDSNEEYAAAVKAEQHRQEAINQMIRLSSFYAVSEEALAGQEPPTFDPMPNVAVPPPHYGAREEPGQPGRVGYAGDPVIASRGTGVADAAVPGGRVDGAVAGVAPAVEPGVDPSMQIDSVGTVAPPQEASKPIATSPATAPAATGTPVPPVGGSGPVTAVGRAGGSGPRQMPISAQGQAPRGVTGGGGTKPGQAVGRSPMQPMGPGGQASATGRGGGAGARGPMGPMGQQAAAGRAGGTSTRGPMGPGGQASAAGRAGARGPMGPMGQQASTGRAGAGARGPMGPGGQASATGRAGGSGPRSAMGPTGQTQPVTSRQTGGRGAGRVTGATPAPHGVAGGVPRNNASTGGQGSRLVQGGAAATGGVVGGRPTGTTPNGPNGTRVPRGTVIGGSDGLARGSGEQPGRRGVVGAPGGSTAGAVRPGRQPGQRPNVAPGGVVGAPSGTASRRNHDKKRSTDGDRRETPPTGG
ncbi:hypothetical protein ABT026_24305 [Streptomyces sp. NPDC002734]|uniref:hypothetical protein n=1 Tax=Streptomyces sp. NPDC002734 TaxID=3154426 RepID=UPI00332B0CBB